MHPHRGIEGQLYTARSETNVTEPYPNNIILWTVYVSVPQGSVIIMGNGSRTGGFSAILDRMSIPIPTGQKHRAEQIFHPGRKLRSNMGKKKKDRNHG